MKYPFTPEILDAMPEEIAELYRTLEITLLERIGSRIKKTGEMNEVTVQSIRALRSHGIPLAEIKKTIKRDAKITDKALDKLLDDVVERNQSYYTGMIDLAQVTKPETLVDAVEINAIRLQMRGELQNITRSMGFVVDSGRTILPPAKAYQWALDNAVIQIQSGAISYDEAIRGAVKQLADSGLKFIEYDNDRFDQIDVAARRAVMTGISQICDQYTEQSMEYLGTRYVEVSAHSGARDKPYPNLWSSHKDWQGRVYYQSANGEADPRGEYPDLVSVTGYGEVDGLCGINCRHKRYPFIPGVMERTYTDEQLDNIDPPPFKFEGKTYSAYEAEQKQRQIERTMRKLKRECATFEAAGQYKDAQTAGIRLIRLTSEYKAFSRAGRLKTQLDRASVYPNG